MAFTWESLYSFFSPTTSPQGTPSLLSSAFFSKSSETTNTKQTDLPMPPTSAFTSSGAPIPSPADSSSSLAPSERDYFPPTSPYTHRSPSMSSTSTASTARSELHHPQRTLTTPAPEGEQGARPEAPRRSATAVVAPETMSREFPKPAHEPSLDELLARAPGKWSLGHYVKNARVRVASRPAAETEAEERARKFEETKRELLRAKAEIEAIASSSSSKGRQ